MYEALRHFSTKIPDGSIVRLQPGDEVLGFETWPPRNQQAALATHMVRVQPADRAIAVHRLEPTVAEVREQTSEALARAARAQREAMAGSATVEKTLTEVIVPIEGSVVDAAKAVESLPVYEDTSHKRLFQCEDCSFTSHSAAGFKMHCDRKHG